MPALNNHYVVTHPPTSVDVTSNGNMLLTPDLRDVALRYEVLLIPLLVTCDYKCKKLSCCKAT